MVTVAELQDAARSRLGEFVAGRWKIERLLGVGGVAAVYEAKHRNGKRVALKILHGLWTSHQGARTRFLQEPYLANRVGHPAVVEIDDDGLTVDSSPFLVMELIQGQTLENLRKESGGKLSAERVLSLTIALLELLAVAHDKGIIHRDLKPENLMLDGEGRLRVLDFGLARVLEEDNGEGLTQPGAALGTPEFMPPEQAMGRWELVDARTDLWAVGATMYRLLSGLHVHRGSTVQQRLVAAGSAPARRLEEVAEGLDPRLCSVVDRALSYAKADRHEDARAMLDAVREVAGEELRGPKAVGRRASRRPPASTAAGRVKGAEKATLSLEDAQPSSRSVRDGALPLGQAVTRAPAEVASRRRWAGLIALGSVAATLLVLQTRRSEPESSGLAAPTFGAALERAESDRQRASIERSRAESALPAIPQIMPVGAASSSAQALPTPPRDRRVLRPRTKSTVPRGVPAAKAQPTGTASAARSEPPSPVPSRDPLDIRD